VSISCKNIQEYSIEENYNSFFLCVRRAEISGFQREFRGAHTTSQWNM